MSARSTRSESITIGATNRACRGRQHSQWGIDERHNDYGDRRGQASEGLEILWARPVAHEKDLGLRPSAERSRLNLLNVDDSDSHGQQRAFVERRVDKRRLRQSRWHRHDGRRSTALVIRADRTVLTPLRSVSHARDDVLMRPLELGDANITPIRPSTKLCGTRRGPVLKAPTKG